MKHIHTRFLSLILAVVIILACFSSIPAYSVNAATNDIPDDAASYNGHRYKLYNDANTWQEAEEKCEQRGGHLATFSSKEENDFVYSYIKSQNVKSAYFGFTDSATEGTWTWVTGESVVYTNWSSGEPNGENPKEDYAMFYYKFQDGKWNDGDFGGITVNGGKYYICEWDGNVPDWYNFLENDSYNFRNYSSTIDLKLFKKMFGNAKGTAFDQWREQRQQSGVCFGMTYTTAAMLNGYPSCDRIRSLINMQDSFSHASSCVKIGEQLISISDYIDFAHIYQFTSQFNSNSTWSDAATIYSLVKSSLRKNKIGVTIGLTHHSDVGHCVLAVGIDGQDILIDDPNNTEYLERIRIYGDGSWSFSGLKGWNSTTCRLRYSTDFQVPYEWLVSGITDSYNPEDEDRFSSLQIDTADQDKQLLTISGADFNTNTEDVIEIIPEENAEDSENDARIFWINNSDTLELQGSNESESSFSLAGNDVIVHANIPDSSKIELSASEEDNASAKIVDATVGNTYDIGITSFTDDGQSVDISISGTASSENILAKNEDNTVLVSGLNQVTITYTEDADVTDTVSIPVLDGREVAITINEQDAIETDYNGNPCNHNYKSTVTAPTCTEQGYTTHTCSVCGDSYRDSYTNALGHDYVDHEAEAATCAEIGWEAYQTCSRCDYTTYKEISALGHDWGEPVYDWADDHSAITATRVCKRDPDHTETENGVVTSAVTKEATYDAEGEITYTATFTNPAFEPQTAVVSLPRLERPTPTPAENPFTDIRESAYYHDPVLWAVANNVTNGTSDSTFSPDEGCTRAQVVTFLWRAAGKPDPASSESPFSDVKEGAYYYNAVLWAVEKGITNGTSDKTFSPDETCTRAQIVTFLWRYEEQPAPAGTSNPFADVKPNAYFGSAVLWAVEKGITNGTSATTFDPEDTCTRAQVVTFLYRDIVKS